MTQTPKETASTTQAHYGFDKVYLGGEVCKWLSILKGRLQWEEGPIARLALCTSLGERFPPDMTLVDQEHGKTFLVQALTGPPGISLLLFALLRQRMYNDGFDPGDPVALEQQFRAHLSRGMLTLGVRVKHLEDVGRIVLEAQERFQAKLTAAAVPDLESPATSSAVPAHVGVTVDGEPRDNSTHVRELAFTSAMQDGPARVADQASFTETVGEGTHELHAMSLWGALFVGADSSADRKGSAHKKRGVSRRRKKRR